MKRKIFLFLFSLFLITSLGGFEQVLACLCGKAEICESFKSADVVFVGRVAEIKSGTRKIRALDSDQIIEIDATRYKFAVHEVFTNNKNITELTMEDGGTSCDVDFIKDKDYLVFAYQQESGDFVTHQCTPTKLAEEAQKELSWLRNTTLRAKTGTIIGRILNSSSGNFMPKISVNFQNINFPKRIFSSRTDVRGFFKAQLPIGKYKMVPRLPKSMKIAQLSMKIDGDWRKYDQNFIELKPDGCEQIAFIVKNK